MLPTSARPPSTSPHHIFGHGGGADHTRPGHHRLGRHRQRPARGEAQACRGGEPGRHAEGQRLLSSSRPWLTSRPTFERPRRRCPTPRQRPTPPNPVPNRPRPRQPSHRGTHRAAAQRRRRRGRERLRRSPGRQVARHLPRGLRQRRHQEAGLHRGHNWRQARRRRRVPGREAEPRGPAKPSRSSPGQSAAAQRLARLDQDEPRHRAESAAGGRQPGQRTAEREAGRVAVPRLARLAALEPTRQ